MANLGFNNDARRFSLHHLLVCVAVLAILFAVARLAIRAYDSIFTSFSTFSAVWLTHDMLVAHMSQTNGKWPTEWNDLEPHFASINPKGYGVPDLDWVRDRVTINFDFDPSALDPSTARHDNAIPVMQMSDGTDNGEIRNANQRIRPFVLDRRSSWSSRKNPDVIG